MEFNEKNINISKRRDAVIAFMVLIIAVYGIIEYKKYEIKEKFANASATNTIESYNEFIDKYLDSEYRYEAIKRRDSVAFSLARKNNTFDAYQNFLDSYPKSEWSSNAIYFRDKSALEYAKEEKTLDAIITFLRKYPESSWVSNARYYLRHQFGFNHESEVNLLPKYNIDEK